MAQSKNKSATTKIAVGTAGSTGMMATTPTASQQASPLGGGVNVQQAARERPLQPELKLSLLEVKFDGDHQQLGFFLIHVLTYMEVYGRTLPSKEARIRVVTLALEGAAAW